MSDEGACALPARVDRSIKINLLRVIFQRERAHTHPYLGTQDDVCSRMNLSMVMKPNAPFRSLKIIISNFEGERERLHKFREDN
jgi:hypothetical protein